MQLDVSCAGTRDRISSSDVPMPCPHHIDFSNVLESVPAHQDLINVIYDSMFDANTHQDL